MKTTESISSKPVKVRKNAHLSPLHKRSNLLPTAALSSELKTKYARNSVRVRIGDSVKLLRGEYSGIEGKVQKVFPKEGSVSVEGITREKIAGGNTSVKIHTSNVVVTGLSLSDKWRRTAVEGTH